MAWIMRFQACVTIQESSLVQWCWPDGKSFLKQEQITIDAFGIIQSEVLKQVQYQMEKAYGRKPN